MPDWQLHRDADGGFSLASGGIDGHAVRARAIIGKAGLIAASQKREGDRATPVGRWLLRHLYFRQDRVGQPVCCLPKTPITPSCGWCDDPASPAYNCHVTMPFAASHETMWRDDGAYDLVVMLGYNDAPPVAGRGSAIFLHCIAPGKTSTAGCVAVARDDLLRFLALAETGQALLVPDLTGRPAG